MLLTILLKNILKLKDLLIIIWRKFAKRKHDSGRVNLFYRVERCLPIAKILENLRAWRPHFKTKEDL